MEFFEISSSDHGSKARLGILHTPHGDILTPGFLPWGTQAVSRHANAGELIFWGASALLVSTYHVWQRPGEAVIAQSGGLHKFLGTNAPLATDGGSSFFRAQAAFADNSLAPRNATFGEQGIIFQAGSDARLILLSPELSIQIQVALGSDIAFVLSPSKALGSLKKHHSARSLDWALRSKRQFDKLGAGSRQKLYATLGDTGEEREELFSAGFDGYAAPRAVREPDGMRALTERMPNIPFHAPEVESPAELVQAAAAGIDTFDSIHPMALAHQGVFLAMEKMGNGYYEMDLHDRRFADDALPPDSSCDCFVCINQTRASIHKLFAESSAQAARFATMHNYKFYLNLIGRIRRSIQYGSFSDFAADFRLLLE